MSEDGPAIKNSHIPNEIILILRKSKKIRFKELKEKLQISGPTLSIHLKDLIKDGSIKFEKKGREKHYSVNKKIPSSVENRIDKFASDYLFHIEMKFDFPSEDEEYESTYEAWNDVLGMIGTYFLFTLFKSIETGEDWSKGFNAKMLSADILDYMCNQLIKDYYNTDLSYYVINNKKKFFKEINSMLDKKSKQTLKIWFDNLKEFHPQHLHDLKKAAEGKLIKYNAKK